MNESPLREQLEKYSKTKFQIALGLKWGKVGVAKLTTENEIQHEALAVAHLKGKFTFTEDEWKKLNVPQSNLSYASYIKVGTSYFQPDGVIVYELKPAEARKHFTYYLQCTQCKVPGKCQRPQEPVCDHCPSTVEMPEIFANGNNR